MKDIYRSKIEYDRFLFSIQEESLKKRKISFSFKRRNIFQRTSRSQIRIIILDDEGKMKKYIPFGLGLLVFFPFMNSCLVTFGDFPGFLQAYRRVNELLSRPEDFYHIARAILL